MNIVVCTKEVPSTTAEKRLLADMRLDRGVEAIVNPFDEYAVEEGLRQKEKAGGEVTILCMGPATGKETIRKSLAMGADKGVLITDPQLAGSDSLATARVLAAALKKLAGDVVIFGSASTDANGGVVASATAELLGLPLLSFASKLEVKGNTATIHRQSDNGYQVVEASIPVLVSVVKAINEPRYPTMKNIMQSKKKEIMQWSLADIGVDLSLIGVTGAREKVLSQAKVPAQRKLQKHQGVEGAAQRIVQFLIDEKVM